MATKKYVKDVQKDKGKFGHYKTGTGGGEPIPAGKKRTTEKRDPDQPRDSEGRFSYNAINGKPLKEISKVHGHSRGTTIPPTLTGGVGGIHYYSDSSHDHLVEGAQDDLAKYTSLTFEDAYRKGDKIIGFDGKVAIASKDFIESATEYVANKKEENKLSGALKELADAKEAGKSKEDVDEIIDRVLKAGHFEGDPTGSWKRKEATSAEEKAALAKAQVEGTQGHELVERKREAEVPAVPKSSVATYLRKSGTGYVAPSIPTSSRQTSMDSATTSASYTPKYDAETVSKIGKALGDESITSEEIEELISENPGIKETVEKIMTQKEEPTPDVEEKVEEVKENISDGEIKTIEELSDEITKEKKEDVVKALYKDESLRKGLRKFAKQWAEKHPEHRGLSDIDLTIKFIDDIYENHQKAEKEEALKTFRGE